MTGIVGNFDGKVLYNVVPYPLGGMIYYAETSAETDDACSFTDEEMKLFWEILSKNSVDTGINIFDDRFWFRGDDGIEMVVPYLGLLHGKMPEGRYDNIINELNSLGCTSFIITSEQIKSLLDEKDDD